MKFMDFVLERISSNITKSILLYGDGGIGKTTALLELHRLLLEKMFFVDNKLIVPIYIPLNEFSSSGSLGNDYIRSHIVGTYLSDHLNDITISNLENIILDATESKYYFFLLCDGINETADERLLTSEIIRLSKLRNVTIILTSRYRNDVYKNFDTKEIKGLDKDIVKQIVFKELKVKEIDESLLDILCNPFYLSKWLQIPLNDKKNNNYNRSSLMRANIKWLIKKQLAHNSSYKIKFDGIGDSVSYEKTLSMAYDFLCALSWAMAENNTLVVDVCDNNWNFAKTLYREEMFSRRRVIYLGEDLFYDFYIPLGFMKKTDKGNFVFAQQNYRDFLAAEYLSNENFGTLEEKISYKHIVDDVVTYYIEFFKDKKDCEEYLNKANQRITTCSQKRNKILNSNIIKLFGEVSSSINGVDFSERDLSLCDFSSFVNLANCNFSDSFFGERGFFTNLGYSKYKPYSMHGTIGYSYLENRNIFGISRDDSDYFIDASTGEIQGLIYDENLDVWYKCTDYILENNALIIIHGTERGNIIFIDVDNKRQSVFYLGNIDTSIIKIRYVPKGILVLSQDHSLFLVRCSISGYFETEDKTLSAKLIYEQVVDFYIKDEECQIVLLDKIVFYRIQNFNAPTKIIDLPQRLDVNVSRSLSRHQEIINKMLNHVTSVGIESPPNEFVYLLNLLQIICPSLKVEDFYEIEGECYAGVDEILYADSNIIITTSDIFYDGKKLQINENFDDSFGCFYAVIPFEKLKRLLVVTTAKEPDFIHEFFLLNMQTEKIEKQSQSMEFSTGFSCIKENDNTVKFVFDKKVYCVKISSDGIESFVCNNIKDDGMEIVSWNKEGYLLAPKYSSVNGFRFVLTNYVEKWRNLTPVGALFEKNKITLFGNVLFVPVTVFGALETKLLKIDLDDGKIEVIQQNYISGKILDPLAEYVYSGGLIYHYNYTDNKRISFNNQDKKNIAFYFAHPINFYGDFGIGAYQKNVCSKQIKKYGRIDVSDVEHYRVIDVEFPEHFDRIVLGKNRPVAIGINKSKDLVFMDLTSSCDVINVIQSFSDEIESFLYCNDETFFWRSKSNIYSLDKKKVVHQRELKCNEALSWSDYHQLPVLLCRKNKTTSVFLLDKCLKNRTKVFELPYVGTANIKILDNEYVVAVDREYILKLDTNGNIIYKWYPYMFNLTGSNFKNIENITEGDINILLQYGADPFN